MADGKFNFCPQCGSYLCTLTNAEGKEIDTCTCGYTNYRSPNVGVLCILTNSWNPGKVLLVKTVNHLDWVLPGGYLEKFETIEEGVTRELREELDIHHYELFGLGYETNYSSPSGNLVIFCSALLGSGADLKVGSDVTVFDWFSLDYLPKMKYASHRKAIADFSWKLRRKTYARPIDSCDI